ncbi:hypothetical protein BDR26DRAFT_723797 [Obelidium mucronatum]|nr:hypothetical protein BDR26DRAFT_723797 [Obelidium mucronatum]
MSSSSKRGRDEDSEMDHSPPPNTSMAFTHPEARNILLPPPSKRQAVGVGFSAVNAPTAFNPILRAPPVTTTSYSSSQHQSKHPVELVKEELERYSSSESFAAGKLSHAICLLETVNARDPLVLTEKFTIPRRTCVYLLWIIQNLDEKTAGAVVAEEASCPKEIKHWFEGLCANSSFRSTENVKLILDVHEKFVEFVKVCRDAVQGRDLGHMMERLVERAVRIHARRSILVNAYGVMEIFMDLLVHSTDMEFHRDFVRYCWVMFLLWREFTPRDQVFDAENTICSVVFFASVQVPSSKRKTLKSISMRANRQYPDYDHDNDWTHNANLVYPLVSGIMSEKVQSFNNELVFRNETLFQNIIKSPYFDGRKKSTPIDGIIFESYEGLLGDGPKGSLSNLVEVLNQHYEQQHATDKLDFDYRLILPAFRVFATPRKRMQSTSSTASPMRSNRSLKTVFARASVFTTQMLTTPITARSTIKGIDGGTHHQYSAMNNSELKITLERVFGGNLSHPDEIDRRARVVFMNAPSCGVEAMNRLKEFIKSLKSIVPESEKAWDLVAAIYIRFLESFVPVCPQFDKKNRTQLLYDRQYHLCLLLCAYEVIRYSHEISMRSFDIVLRLFDINYVELCIVIDMLHKSQLWFSVSLLKRFFEIRERLLESEVWKSQRVYDPP